MSDLGRSGQFEQTAQADPDENVLLQRPAGIIAMTMSEQALSRAANAATVLAVLGALATLYVLLPVGVSVRITAVTQPRE